MADEQPIQAEAIPQTLSHLIGLNERYGVLHCCLGLGGQSMLYLWLQLPYILKQQFLDPDAAAPRELQALTSPFYSSLLELTAASYVPRREQSYSKGWCLAE
jgi:hypothetical protein